MRVLHVVDGAGRRGAEIFTADLVIALSELGVEQAVALLHGDGSQLTDVPAMMRPLAPAGVRIPVIRMNLGTLRRLRRLQSDWRPDVVQANGGEALKYAAMTSGGRRGTPFVYRRIGAAPPWITHGPRRLVYSRLMRRASRVVLVASALQGEASEVLSIPRSSVRVIPNGVDARRVRPTRAPEEVRRALGVPEATRMMLSVGALTWEKDPLVHVEVSRRLRDRGLRAVHVMVGDGPMRRDVEAAVRAAGLQARVVLLGFRQDVPDLMAAADVLLFASREDGMEGMPAVLIEAGMTGLPAVAYGIGGVPEVVADGETGVVVQSGDLDGLASGAAELLDDPDRRYRLGAAGRERCARFDIRAVAPRYLAVYRELAGGGVERVAAGAGQKDASR